MSSPVLAKPRRYILHVQITTTVPGTKLYTVSAVDRDANEDRNLTFSLMNVTDQFSINVLTGDVTLEKSLDYESMGQQKYFNITIQVEDAGPGMKQTATMMLPIYVIDADDQGPAFVYTGCFTHSTVCVWPQYTTGLELKRNQAITVYPVPNKVKGQVTINAYDLDTDIGNEINFSIASTIPPGQETNFKVETIKGQGSEYIANIVSLVDLQLSEGFEIFLKAEEKSENRRHAIAMVYFTSTPATTPTAEQQQGSSSSTKDSGYSDLEIALIVVVSILATFLVSLILVEGTQEMVSVQGTQEMVSVEGTQEMVSVEGDSRYIDQAKPQPGILQQLENKPYVF
ncbi:hypothetical protein Btru_028074 [Bulinus truncatus]|nr:hypothetical protein Btru_028074 [Bulinus truncatus]